MSGGDEGRVRSGLGRSHSTRTTRRLPTPDIIPLPRRSSSGHGTRIPCCPDGPRQDTGHETRASARDKSPVVMPIESRRSQVSKHYFGAHTMDTGGIHMAARRAGHAGMHALQIFSAVPKYYNEKISVK